MTGEWVALGLAFGLPVVLMILWAIAMVNIK
jgi:hypothetical protein